MFHLFSNCLGIDLGTVQTTIYQWGKGVVVSEPSVVAVNDATGQVVAAGREAGRMLGRTPSGITAVRPLRDGVIADFSNTQHMLKYFIRKGSAPSVFRGANVVIAVPTAITEVERRAVEEAARQAGARGIYLIDQPLAAALGADLDITQPRGRMVVDIGGGTTEVAVVSLGGTAVRQSVKIGGNTFDRDIADYVRRKYNIFIGETTAEQIKIQIGSVFGGGEQMTVKGRSLLSGLPAGVQVEADEVCAVMKSGVDRMVDAVRQTLENTPPELAADIAVDGILMTGGTSQLRGLDKLISAATGIAAAVTESPTWDVAKGAGKMAEKMFKERRGLPREEEREYGLAQSE